jgi:ABC-type transport system substrate-binding protein
MRHPVFGTGNGTPLGLSDHSKAALAAKYVRQAISYAMPRNLIIQQLLNGYGNPGITTPVIGDYATGYAVTQGFNSNLTPYAFNLTKARELLQAAGYFPAGGPPQSIWDTYGFAIAAVLVAATAALAVIYFRERRRNRTIRQAAGNSAQKSTSPLQYLEKIQGKQPVESSTSAAKSHANSSQDPKEGS